MNFAENGSPLFSCQNEIRGKTEFDYPLTVQVKMSKGFIVCHMQICPNYFGHTSLVKIKQYFSARCILLLKTGCKMDVIEAMILNGYINCLTQVEEDFL